MREQRRAVPLGRDPRASRLPDLRRRADEVALDLPAQGRVGVEQPGDHVHPITVDRGADVRHGRSRLRCALALLSMHGDGTGGGLVRRRHRQAALVGRLALDGALHRPARARHRAARRCAAGHRPRRSRAGTTTGEVGSAGGTARRWTDAFKFSGEEQSLAGIVVDGRWIHFGALSQPVAGAIASYVSGAELIKRGRLSRARRRAHPLRPVGPDHAASSEAVGAQPARATSSWRWPVRCGSRRFPRDRMPRPGSSRRGSTTCRSTTATADQS